EEAREQARQQASQQHGALQAIAFLQADAEYLPMGESTCDRVLAAHMLYHVPDQVLALREMRRVLRPGARVILTTMTAEESRLHAIHCQAAQQLGYTPTPGPAARFSLDDLPLVRSVFPSAERHVLEDAFRFPMPEAALQYYLSGPVDRIEEWRDEHHRARLLPLVHEKIESIIRQEGVFRDPKSAGCFVAEI
ncbi:MAG TPA: class I SAM-dependent methyltransferase, partial [Chloroflexota bacterium]|nr:class I SAM-dependent methyltransferase [Chloroflexota bacterium]